MKIIGTVLSKALNPLSKLEYKTATDPDGNPYSFFYILISEGTQKTTGSGQFQRAMEPVAATVPHGALCYFDTNKNITKQVDVFKMFVGDISLPPVIDIELLADKPITSKENQANVHSFYTSIAGICDKRKLKLDPIIRCSSTYLLTNLRMNDGDIPEWMYKANYWITDIANNEVLPEFDDQVIFTGYDKFVEMRGTKWDLYHISTEHNPERNPKKPIAVAPYYVQVTNIEGTQVYDKPTIDSKKMGRCKYRSILRITQESGAFAFAGQKVQNWVLKQDIEPYKPNSKK